MLNFLEMLQMLSHISGLTVDNLAMQQNVELVFTAHNVDQVTVILFSFAYMCNDFITLRKKSIYFLFQGLKLGFS